MSISCQVVDAILFEYPGIWLIVFEMQLFGAVHSDLQNFIRFSWLPSFYIEYL